MHGLLYPYRLYETVRAGLALGGVSAKDFLCMATNTDSSQNAEWANL